MTVMNVSSSEAEGKDGSSPCLNKEGVDIDVYDDVTPATCGIRSASALALWWRPAGVEHAPSPYEPPSGGCCSSGARIRGGLSVGTLHAAAGSHRAAAACNVCKRQGSLRARPTGPRTRDISSKSLSAAKRLENQAQRVRAPLRPTGTGPPPPHPRFLLSGAGPLQPPRHRVWIQRSEDKLIALACRASFVGRADGRQRTQHWRARARFIGALSARRAGCSGERRAARRRPSTLTQW